MSRINDLRGKRAQLITTARGYANKAETEKRDMNTEERSAFDKIMDVELKGVDTEIKDAEAHETRMSTLAAEETRLKESAGRQTTPGNLEQRGGGAGGATEYRYKIDGTNIERKIPLSGVRASDAYHKLFSRALVTPLPQLAASAEELRALQADSDSGGGYLQGSQVFVAQLIQAIDNLTFVRRLANVLPPLQNSESVGIPTRESDVADADWTAEIATGAEDSSLTFGKRELKPHPLAKRIKVSKKLLRSAAMDPEAIVRQRLAYKEGVTQEKGFLIGTGANQPLGVMTASANGISTARDISTNSTTLITADSLFDAKFALKVQYWARAQWAFHRDAVKQVSKLKDGDGQYLWQIGLTAGSPDRLLGLPVNLSEYMPNTFTTGKYVGIVGDWSQYWIVDSLNMTIQVLLELYAETNQNGYILRAETDGAPVLEEAFARLKTA